MPQVTLSDIQKAADAKFGDFIAVVGEEELRFLNPVRLPKEKRQAIRKLMHPETEHPEDFEVTDFFRSVFELSAETKKTFEKLDAAVGNDAAVWEGLFDAMNTETEVGEA